MISLFLVAIQLQFTHFYRHFYGFDLLPWKGSSFSPHSLYFISNKHIEQTWMSDRFVFSGHPGIVTFNCISTFSGFEVCLKGSQASSFHTFSCSLSFSRALHHLAIFGSINPVLLLCTCCTSTTYGMQNTQKYLLKGSFTWIFTQILWASLPFLQTYIPNYKSFLWTKIQVVLSPHPPWFSLTQWRSKKTTCWTFDRQKGIPLWHVIFCISAKLWARAPWL